MAFVKREALLDGLMLIVILTDKHLNGWICLNHETRVKNKRLMLHEVAHLIAGYKYHHGDVWRRALLKIGGTLKEFPITKRFWSADMHRKTRHDYLLHRAQTRQTRRLQAS